MSPSLTCLTCSKPFVVIKQFAGVKQKRFCSTHCNDVWWNEQPLHPVIPRVDAAHPRAVELRGQRTQLVLLEKADPYTYGFVPDHWEIGNAQWALCQELLISGGNRAGKTLWAARRIVQTLLEKENASVLCCHTSHATSVTVQQPAIYNYLPVALRGTKKGRIHYLNYSRKNGFTDGSFILPNGSRCDFLNYTQSENTIEGREADMVWCDELVPQMWVDTLRYRLVTRRGKLLVTQTPLEGVASVYKDFTAGAKVLVWDKGELLEKKQGLPTWPVGKAPRVMQQVATNRRTVFYFSEDNPYNPWDEMKSKLVTAPVAQVLIRAYGWASELVGRAFSRFRPEVHCIPATSVPDGGTLYMICDPAGARNWFALWIMVYEDGKRVVVREWPGYGSYGEWVLPSEKADGKAGPAQLLEAGRSIAEYRKLFRQVEEELGKGEPVMRLIDPKAGGSPALSAAGGTTLIDLLAESEDPMDEGMAFVPAPGVPVDQRTSVINSHLSYDATQELTPLNEPSLYIVQDCFNLVYSLSEHTGRDGQKGATKDPIDCLGMLLVSGLAYVGRGGFDSRNGGGGY
jgi:Terminase large subunit, T4likevirus-type, N-terminal